MGACGEKRRRWVKFLLYVFSHIFILSPSVRYPSILYLITGHPKKSVSRTVHLFFVWLYCCFIQTWCINNDWKCDFWHPRCLFYQVESILFHFQQLEILVFQKFPWNTAKMVKNLQCLKIPQICYLRLAEQYAKTRTSLRVLDHDTLFFGWPVMYTKFFLYVHPLIIYIYRFWNS